MNHYFKKISLLLAVILTVNSAALVNPVSTKAAEEKTQTAVPVLQKTEVLTASSVRLTWSSDSSFYGVYIVYRKSKDTDYSIIGGLYATGKSSYAFTDVNVLAGREYTYMIAAVPEDDLEDVMSGASSTYSSENYGRTTVKWHAPNSGKATCYLVFADRSLISISDSSASSYTHTYPYNFGKKTGEPDFEVYAILKRDGVLDNSNTMSVKTTLSSSDIKKISVVGNKKARINWKKSQGATGYIVYRRTSAKKSWKKMETVTGDDQLFCYDDAVAAKKKYYYAVRAFVEVDGEKAYSSLSKGKKAYFKKVSKAVKKGDYKVGSVYGPALNTKQLSQVKSAVKKFCDNYITTDMSNLEKVMTAQLYMAGTCIYAKTWAKHGANTAWGSLVYKNSKGYHEAQCSGFARGFKALCDGMGIKCRYVHANSKSLNPDHQWNEVKLDGKWYIVDPQASANAGYLAFFLCSGKTYTNSSGMKWDKKSYPALSSKDYSAKKISAAYQGYKIQRIYKKIFK
ncbi:MAG: transglutaminase domain-containing protein [Lachnospiraceae bacterium]|nr:transglutaminase domain-containing protein [Lachnospiraceae bacterium]